MQPDSQVYQFGDVLLLSFPFTNLVGTKRRPALVILDTRDGDIVVARITSQIYETEFDALLDDWQQAGLMMPSVVRIHKIATLEQQLVERKLGKLTDEDLAQVGAKLQLLCVVEPAICDDRDESEVDSGDKSEEAAESNADQSP
jgi:mRNA interferase MazF